MYTLFVTVYLVIPLPETPSSHTVYINIYIYIYNFGQLYTLFNHGCVHGLSERVWPALI